MPSTCEAVAPSTSESAPRPVLPDQGVDLGRSLPPRRQLLRRRVGVHQPLRGLEGVHDADLQQLLLLRGGQRVVRRVGAGELGLAAGRGDRVRAQHRGHDRDVVGGAVEVPVERSPQVLGDRVLRRVERHPEDLRAVAPAHELHPAELPAERHLRLVVEVQVAEHEGAVLVEHPEAPLGEGVVVEQPVAVDAQHLRTDGGAELLGGQYRHRSSPSVVTIPRRTDRCG